MDKKIIYGKYSDFRLGRTVYNLCIMNFILQSMDLMAPS